MTEKDVNSVMRIQAECYVSSILETEEVIRGRLSGFHETAWVAEDAQGVCGYLLAYKSRAGKITPLGALFDKLDDVDCITLHDLAVSERVKGQGIGNGLARVALDYAIERGLPYSSLVSVQGSQPFWRKLGYEVLEAASSEQEANLMTYERRARYMVKKLAVSRK